MSPEAWSKRCAICRDRNLVCHVCRGDYGYSSPDDERRIAGNDRLCDVLCGAGDEAHREGRSDLFTTKDLTLSICRYVERVDGRGKIYQKVLRAK